MIQKQEHITNQSTAVYHPTGNRNVRAVLEAFVNHHQLDSFYTTIGFDPDSFFGKLLPSSVKNEMMRRVFSVPKDQLHSYPFREYARLVLPKLGLRKLVAHENKWASVDAVYTDFDRHNAKQLLKLKNSQLPNAVYAYEDGALELFKAAKQRGVRCIYDLPIAYWETGRRLMKEQAEYLPEWSITLGGGILDSEKKLQRKTEEMQLADVIVGPGSFVMDSIPDWAKTKKRIVSPFGSPENEGPKALNFLRNKDHSKPLRVLFVGSMGQRKGLGDLFSAIRSLKNKNIELVVMGSLLAPIEFYKTNLPDFTFEKGRPHHQVLELMSSCDVFCLPSIVEGRALVMQEAMSRGLPILITPNTGGADLVIEGKTGFLVPINAPERIAEKLQWFENNRTETSEMGLMAMQHAATYTWKNYGDHIVSELNRMKV